jgi:hypothetical protein
MKILLVLMSLSAPSLFDGDKPKPIIKRSEVGRFIKKEIKRFQRIERREIKKIKRKSVPLKGTYIPEGYYT